MKRNITRILVILAIILNISFLCSCVPSVTKVRTKMNKANYNGERIYYDDLMTFDEAGIKNILLERTSETLIIFIFSPIMIMALQAIH